MEKLLFFSPIETPLGTLKAIGDDSHLLFLKFSDVLNLEEEITKLLNKTGATLRLGRSKQIVSIQEELDAYFQGRLKKFKTPTHCFGSPFQKSVWEELKKIPYGETRAYSDIASAICKPSACRAAAQANRSNLMAIIIPCHRVIRLNGEYGGYEGGCERKIALIQHERRRQ